VHAAVFHLALVFGLVQATGVPIAFRGRFLERNGLFTGR
jgi:hypothetical protein